MFCDRCGTQLPDASNFCTNCGKALAPLAATPVASSASPAGVATPDGRVRRNLNIVAGLWVAYAIVRLTGIFWLYAVGRMYIPSVVSAIVSASSPVPHRFPLGFFISSSLAFLAAWLGIWALIQLVTSWGLFERAPWARVVAIVLAFLALLRFPLGTALGIYTLWVLLPSRAGAEYEQLARTS